jgi:cytochrome c oxidase accessory protein FixG
VRPRSIRTAAALAPAAAVAGALAARAPPHRVRAHDRLHGGAAAADRRAAAHPPGLPHRRFTLFGTTFFSTETVLFMLLFLGGLIGIFLVTARRPRVVWLGVPAAVYLEFLFRPVERLLERGWQGSRAMDRERGRARTAALAQERDLPRVRARARAQFLAYFVPWEGLRFWLVRSPVQHSTSFLLVMITTGLIYFDFAYFREQTCLVACPYGRLQSVLLDRRSMIVGYDVRRGEPRGKLVRGRDTGAGDCVDCRMCVQTCPTGIDIARGCRWSACTARSAWTPATKFMVQIGRPTGLIRYGTRDGFEGRISGWWRPRVVL